MKHNSLARISLAALVAILPATLPAQSRVTVQQAALEKESLELIDQVEDAARSVHDNTDALQLHASSNRSRWTNYHHLREIKESVNNGLNPALNRLSEIKPQLPEWQQHSIDRLLDSARSLASDTNSAILSVNENGSTPIVLNDEYRALLDTMNQHAEKLVRSADAAGDYADALNQALEAGLKVPSHK